MRIVYFDGYCNICNQAVNFLLRQDTRRRLRFAPLQGSTARGRLPARFADDVSTMVFERDGAITTESRAAIHALASLGGLYSLVVLFLVVPRFLLDPIYRWIAGRRHLIAGRRDTCRIPTAEERGRFLD